MIAPEMNDDGKKNKMGIGHEGPEEQQEQENGDHLEVVRRDHLPTPKEATCQYVRLGWSYQYIGHERNNKLHHHVHTQPCNVATSNN
eukprot:TCALIF_08879-PA protein Name:"Protein of unknown function" AED:0.14 eAED:0.14 QI:0/0.5/0.33/1/0/0/3/854/86